MIIVISKQNIDNRWGDSNEFSSSIVKTKTKLNGKLGGGFACEAKLRKHGCTSVGIVTGHVKLGHFESSTGSENAILAVSIDIFIDDVVVSAIVRKHQVVILSSASNYLAGRYLVSQSSYKLSRTRAFLRACTCPTQLVAASITY